ncbi:AbiH family protein [Salinivibrio kushneri]|uniref:AbiH family protein n=1 Tax=Salinivibrio kushneri TaxID=1908198 RepID=UPI0022B383D5|nr:AbiH family protein [Salinivibrio kushneri]WBA12875.1 AbiH family protein [Salinivibrio kushneri]
METLYIIGNGFDLAHKLPTSYTEFYNSERELFDEISWFYDFDDSDNPWCNFEDALGRFSPDSFLSYYNEVDINKDNFRPRDIWLRR